MITFPHILRLSAASLGFLTAAGQLSAHDLKLGTKVDHHVVENEKTDFSAADSDVCAQITLKPSMDGKVTFVWTKDGAKHLALPLPVKESARYRTHACVKATPGQWHVTVTDDAGATLAEKAFNVAGAEATVKAAPVEVQASEGAHPVATPAAQNASPAPVAAPAAPNPADEKTPAHDANSTHREAVKGGAKAAPAAEAIPTLHANPDAATKHPVTSDSARPAEAARVHTAAVETTAHKAPEATTPDAPTAPTEANAAASATTPAVPSPAAAASALSSIAPTAAAVAAASASKASTAPSTEKAGQ